MFWGSFAECFSAAPQHSAPARCLIESSATLPALSAALSRLPLAISVSASVRNSLKYCPSSSTSWLATFSASPALRRLEVNAEAGLKDFGLEIVQRYTI